MNDPDAEDDIDKLVEELKNSDTELKSVSKSPTLSADQINEFIINTTHDLVNNGMQTLEAIQRQVVMSQNMENLEYYGTLLNSITNAMGTVNKINIEQMKQKSAREIKEMDIGSKEKIANKKISAGMQQNQIEGNVGPGSVTNNVLIATREDFFKLLNEESEPEGSPIIDVTED